MDKVLDANEMLPNLSVIDVKTECITAHADANFDDTADIARLYDLRALARAYRFGELSREEYLARRRALISAFQAYAHNPMEDDTLQATPVAPNHAPGIDGPVMKVSTPKAADCERSAQNAAAPSGAADRFSALTWRSIAIMGLLVASAGLATWLAAWLTGL